MKLLKCPTVKCYAGCLKQKMWLSLRAFSKHYNKQFSYRKLGLQSIYLVKNTGCLNSNPDFCSLVEMAKF